MDAAATPELEPLSGRELAQGALRLGLFGLVLDCLLGLAEGTAFDQAGTR
jgi:hypothetical protein